MKYLLFFLLLGLAALASCTMRVPGKIPSHQRYEDARIRRIEPEASHIR